MDAPPRRTYLNFDLLIEADPAGDYRARVLSSPIGETRPVRITIPFSDLELDNFLLRIGRPRNSSVRGWSSPEAAAVRDFGGRLFEGVFRDKIRESLHTSVEYAESHDAGVRIRLRLTDCPELSDLPWEYLYDGDARRFLALSEWTPVIRYHDLPGRIRPLTVQPPLRILVMVADPTDFPRLDADAEWARLREALGDLESNGRVHLDRTDTGSLADLQRRLRREHYHVFHYIGHGTYDADAHDGLLALESPSGRAHLVSGADLGALLHDHRTLRLAVLNSCEGARGDRTDPYAGTANTLLYQGIPAVTAMQFEISDGAAITFTRGLYEAVADGYPLDAAIAEARKAIMNEANPVEWGTPVIYLRAPDGQIFDVRDAAAPETEQHIAPPDDIAPQVDDWPDSVPVLATQQADSPPESAVGEDRAPREPEAAVAVVGEPRETRAETGAPPVTRPPTTPDTGPPPSPARRRRRAWLAAGAVVVAGAAAAAAAIATTGSSGGSGGGSSSSAPPTGSSPPTSGTRPLGPTLGLNQLVTTRRTGTPQTASEQRHLYIVSTKSEKTLRPLFPSASSTWDLLAALSHDRKTIAYTSLAPGGVPEIHLVASDGTHDRTLFSTPPPQNCPIGLRATFVGPDDTSLIVVCDLNPGDRTASRDDQVLAAFGGSDHRLYRVALDGTLIGNALASGDVAAPTVNHVGTKLVFVKDGTIDRSHSQILEVPLSDPGQITQLVSGSGLNDPAFSPVQNQLAYRQGPSQGEHIWLLKPNRQPQQLTFRGPAEGDPSWSPDGTELACTWGPYGSRGLELIDAATGQRLARFDKHGGDGPPAWTAR